MIGVPATGRAAFARTSDSGRSLVASPAVNTSAGHAETSLIRRRDHVPASHSHRCEHHVDVAKPVLVAIAGEQRAIGIRDVVGARFTKRRGGLMNVFLAAFNLDIGAYRGFVDGDHDVFGGEL